MNNPDNYDKELQRKEKELIERERALRLRELENEIYQDREKDPPFYETRKDKPPEKKKKKWLRKLANFGKFAGFVIGMIVAVKIASWLAWAVMIGALSWAGYKIFLESDRED